MEFPDVAKLLTQSRYVDDILKSVTDSVKAQKIIPETEEVLRKVKMEVKGWALSNVSPPEQVTEDGIYLCRYLI